MTCPNCPEKAITRKNLHGFQKGKQVPEEKGSRYLEFHQEAAVDVVGGEIVAVGERNERAVFAKKVHAVDSVFTIERQAGDRVKIGDVDCRSRCKVCGGGSAELWRFVVVP